MRRSLILLALVLLVGCQGGGTPAARTTATAPPPTPVTRHCSLPAGASQPVRAVRAAGGICWGGTIYPDLGDFRGWLVQHGRGTVTRFSQRHPAAFAVLALLSEPTSRLATSQPIPPHRYQVYVNVTSGGNDTTCRRRARNPPCATTARACAIGRAGDRIQVRTSGVNTRWTYESLCAAPCTAPAVLCVATNGNDATGTRGDLTKPFLTFDAAKNACIRGDEIQVRAGTYPGETMLGTPAGTSGVCTFKNVSGAAVWSNGGFTLGTGFSATTPSYLTFDGINIKNGCLNVKHDATAPLVQTTQITYKNAHIWATAAGSSCHLLNLSSVDHFTAQNVELGPMCCGGDALDPVISGTGQGTNPSNLLIDHVYIHDLYDTCNNMPQALKNQYGCSDTGYGDTGTGDHVDAIQAFGCDNCTISNSRIYSINPTSSSTTGAAQGIFFQAANGGSFSNLTFASNMICGADGSLNFVMGGPGAGVFSGYVKFLYNTLCTQAPRIYDGAGGVLAAGTAITYVGNIMPSHFTHTTTSEACPFVATDSSAITPTYRNNLWGTGAACDASDLTGSATLVSTNFYSPDDHLVVNGQAAINGGETTYCGPGKNVTSDVDADARPSNGCDIGGDETSAANPPGIFVNDTFTGTAGTLLQSHVGELGATWTKHPSWTGDAVISNANRLRGNGTSAAYYASGVPASAEYDVQADFVTFSQTGYAAICGRMDTTTNTWYEVTWHPAGQWTLYKNVGGTFTQLGAWTEGTGLNHTVKLQIRNATKKVFIAGFERISSTDNSITGAGRPGVEFDTSGSDTTVWHLDNFTATNP